MWSTATAITNFLEFEPNEGKQPRFATKVWVAYDNTNFYAFVGSWNDNSQDLFNVHPNNPFLVKFTYWFDRGGTGAVRTTRRACHLDPGLLRPWRSHCPGMQLQRPDRGHA